MQFEKEIEILAPREKVWNFIWDVDRFIAVVEAKWGGTIMSAAGQEAELTENAPADDYPAMN